MNRIWRVPLARLRCPARTLAPVVVAGVLAAALAGPARAAADPVADPAPQLVAPVQFRPANVPWPSSTAGARKAARATPIRAWGAREPKVVSVRRVSYSKVDRRVTWRSITRRSITRTVKVKRTSADGVQASAAWADVLSPGGV